MVFYWIGVFVAVLIGIGVLLALIMALNDWMLWNIYIEKDVKTKRFKIFQLCFVLSALVVAGVWFFLL